MLIYKIVNLINNKIYIGQTKKSLKDRSWYHKNRLKRSKHNNQHLQHSWNLYGEHNFKFEVVEYLNLSNGWNLSELEVFYIKSYKSHDMKHGYNLTYGGEGVKPTQETKDKISKSLKANNFSPSKEARERHSLLMTGRRHTKDAIEKITRNHFSKNPTYINPNRGKKLTNEQKFKRRESCKHTKIIARIIETGVEICFRTIDMARKYFNIHHNTVIKCVKGVIPQYKGVVFEYA